MPAKESRRATLSVSVLGKDRSGVVAGFTSLLFDTGGNIESLEEQVHRGFFTMSLVATYPADVDRARVDRDLRALGERLRMEVRAKWTDPRARRRFAAFVTKEAHCLEALLSAKIPGAKLAVVIGNHVDLEPLAKRAGVPFVHVPWNDRARAEERVLAALDEHQVDFIVLARFMKILSPHFVWRWRNRILNIHPSLLPAFPGANAYRQAYERGVRVVGVTAHFVTPGLDEGPIVHQDAFRVKPTDDLAAIVAKGRALEAKVLVEAVRLYLRKRLDVHWGRVWLEEP